MTPARAEFGKESARLVNVWLLVVGLVLALTSASRSVSAQVAQPRSQGPGTLSGIVIDSLGRPVAEATVYLADTRRTALTRANGSFRFDSLKEGQHRIGARAVGFISSRAGAVKVGPDGGVAVIQLFRLTMELPSVTTSARRGGISGVIGDTSYRAMAGVTVQVLGSSMGSASTDTLGEFYLPVKPGSYMVSLDRPGYRRQLIAVTVPADSGRRVAAWLAPMAGKDNPIVGKNMFELEHRLVIRSPTWSRLYTNEDLQNLGIEDALQAAERFAARRLDNDECALIDGGPEVAPLWTISTSEIEMMESYMVSTTRGARYGVVVGRDMPAKKIGDRVCTHVIWLRK